MLIAGHRRCAVCACLLGAAYTAEGQVLSVVVEEPEAYPAIHDGGVGTQVGKHWVCADHYLPGMTPADVQRLKRLDRIVFHAFHAPTDAEGNVLPPLPELGSMPPGGVLVAQLATALGVRPEMVRKKLRSAGARPLGVLTLAPGVRAFVYAQRDVDSLFPVWRTV